MNFRRPNTDYFLNNIIFSIFKIIIDLKNDVGGKPTMQSGTVCFEKTGML
jgi:hypothetical protein